MSFRSLIRDGIGSLSRRSFDSYYFGRSRSSSASAVVSDSPNLKDDIASLQQQQQQQQQQKQSRWANLPPELLRDVIQRLEASESLWPNRKHVVACAAVCRSWRKITMDLVKCPESSGKLTFPRSLKQFGPRDPPVQCYIKRDRSTSTYRLYLGMSPTLMDNGKFLLAARKQRRATSTDYVISLDSEDQSRGSNSYAGKLRSNFLGTKFTIYDSQAPHSGAVASTSRAGRRVGTKQVSPRIPAGSYSIANIVYELNVLGTRGPRRMQCTMHTIPASKMSSGSSSSSNNVLQPEDESVSNLLPVKNNSSSSSNGVLQNSNFLLAAKDGPLVLKNKAPRWHEQLQCWCLNFKGRVTVASVKNFQLVAAPSADKPPTPEHDKVILQFGKIGKDMFTMDFRYPLSAFQAFAICLSSFDTKLACE